MRNHSWGDRLVQIAFTIICFGLAGIPTYFFLFLKSMLSPEGFWQKFLVYGVGIWFLGGLQFVLLIVAIVLVIELWVNL